MELAPLGGILGPLKSDLGVFWAKIPLYPYNVKTQKTHFLKTLSWADFDLLESNSRYIFLHKNQKNYHSTFFFSWCMFSSHVVFHEALEDLKIMQHILHPLWYSFLSLIECKETKIIVEGCMYCSTQKQHQAPGSSFVFQHVR